MSKNNNLESRSIKVRLYPNKAQEELLNKSFGVDRFVYNRALYIKKSKWKDHQENISWQKISKIFTEMKKTEEYAYLNTPSRSVIEQSLMKLDAAYKGFFKLGRGFPNFKKKFIAEDSFVLTDPSRIIGDSHIKLPKLGLMKIKGLRKFDGTIKNVTVKRNKAGEYYATFCISDVEKQVRSPKVSKTIGIDVNLENFLTDSDGNRIYNPRFKNSYINKIKFYQRKLAELYRKNPDKKLYPNWKQSRKYRDYKLKLARLFQKISNKKQDFLHKLSLNYVKNHDIIIVENLQIKNMLKNHNLAESISNISWGEFFTQLEYKSRWYGAHFEKVDPRYTSKICNCCGAINPDLSLKDRVWKCAHCETEHIRDENAAKNIMGRGTLQRIGGETVALALLDDASNCLI